LLMIVACSAQGEVTVVSTTGATTDDSTITTINPGPVELDMGDLGGWETITIEVGGQRLLVALADDREEWSQGLMGVDDLGDIDGMLFVFPLEVTTGFWMKDTLIPLDIAFFDDGLALVDVLTMEPCSANPCPVYVPRGLFSRALETPVGSLGQLDPGAILSVEG